MALTLAIAAGLGSALAYGAGTAGQHAEAYTGSADAGRLVELAKNPRWLLASLGDVLGIALQLVALSNGPVVLIQPLLVLSLPVAVVLRSSFGAPRPSRADVTNCVALILGLALFFILLGEPHRGSILSTEASVWATLVSLVGGGVAIAAMRSRPAVPRAIMFGVVSGCWFGLVSVLVEAVSSVWQVDGLEGFRHPVGIVPLTTVVILAVGGYLLVQLGFQLAPLGASFPPSLILDPVVAVALGAALLSERVPLGSGRILGYLVCIAVVGWAAVRLAEPTSALTGR